MTGVEVKGFEFGTNSRAVTALLTDQGKVACDFVVVGVGPWVNRIWNLLELPRTIAVKGRDGVLHDGVRMWKYWCLEEGTLGVDPDMHKTNDGKMPPVIHVDTDAPLYSDVDGSLITEELWGLYYKPDFNFGGVQGGSSPYVVDEDPDEVEGRSLRAGEPRLHRRRKLRALLVFDAGPLPEAVRGQDRQLQEGREIGRARLLHARQLSGVRRVPRQRLCRGRLRTMATRCSASASWWPRKSPAKTHGCSNRSGFPATPRAGFTRCRKVPSRGVDEHGSA